MGSVTCILYLFATYNAQKQDQHSVGQTAHGAIHHHFPFLFLALSVLSKASTVHLV